MRAERLLPAALLLLVAAAPAAAGEDDIALLLEGVGEIAAPGVPGPLSAFGERAFAVVTGGKTGEAVVAAAEWGRGRVVAFGHTGYFGEAALSSADTGRLVVNAVRWAAGSARESPRVGAIALPGLVRRLSAAGVAAKDLGRDWRASLRRVDVVCVGTHGIGADEEIRALAAFVKSGRGMLAGGLGWGWRQLNAGKDLAEEHPGNRLLAPAGIVWADGTLDRTGRAGYLADRSALPLAGAAAALERLLAQARGKAKLGRDEARRAAAVLTRAARSVPAADPILLPRLRSLLGDAGIAEVPTPEHPLGPEKALARVLLATSLREAAALPPAEVRPHPSAVSFPGEVPAGAPRVTRTVSVDTRVPGWHSLGLYAAPGEVVTAGIPESAAGRGLGLRIGAHRDRLWGKDKWSRVPEIDARFPLDSAATEAASPFGGLIYVEVPGSAAAGSIEVEIGNAVPAPLFVLGETDAGCWREEIRDRPAPWAELATGKVVLTVPAAEIRALDDPRPVLELWNRVLDACADLATRPRERNRPERYVADVQISAGYMHAGYPIMTHLDAAAAMVSESRMKAGNWGLFHEMGHNHQSRDWTFDGAGEVTVNLFTLYVLETVCGKARGKARKGFPVAGERLDSYLAKPGFERWKRDPFLALTMYDRVVDAFGWGPIKAVFAEYRDLPAGERPRTDAEKRDQWLVRLSRRIGRNLGPFFQRWGIPTSQAARNSIASLEPWSGPVPK